MGRASPSASSHAPTVDAAIRKAARQLAASATPWLDARLLVGRALNLDATGLVLAGGGPISAQAQKRVDAFVARRCGHEPIAQILGEKEFFGLAFAIRDGVLTPRPDSETLIEAILEARCHGARQTMLDLGAGSGCLIVALLTLFPYATGVAVDRRPEAAGLTLENARRHGVADRLSVVVGDWTSALRGSFDVIVTNPPYISDEAKDDLSPDVRDYEDAGALFGGPDGLDAYRAIFKDVASYLSADGFLAAEHGAGQASAVARLLRAGFPGARLSHRRDLAGRSRCVCLDRAAQSGGVRPTAN